MMESHSSSPSDSRQLYRCLDNCRVREEGGMVCMCVCETPCLCLSRATELVWYQSVTRYHRFGWGEFQQKLGSAFLSKFEHNIDIVLLFLPCPSSKELRVAHISPCEANSKSPSQLHWSRGDLNLGLPGFSPTWSPLHHTGSLEQRKESHVVSSSVLCHTTAIQRGRGSHRGRASRSRDCTFFAKRLVPPLHVACCCPPLRSPHHKFNPV